ncbi:MAG: histidine kinase [Candidatus Nanopelagicales bacterium]|nr:histidine kinase [Candidatus Nanopelagicales bacterium]
MTAWPLASVALIAGASLAAGLLMLQERVDRMAGALLACAGVVGLLSAWLLVGEASRASGVPALLLAALVLFPAALWAYPRPRWRHPLDFVLGVLLVSPGVVAVLTSDDLGVVASMAVLAGVVLVAQTWWRLERATGAERRALLWSSLALGSAVLCCLVLTFLVRDPDGLVLAVAVAPLAAVPAAMAIGVLRPEIVEVRGLVVNVGVFVVLGVGYIAAFVGLVSLVELLRGDAPTQAALAVIGLLGAIAYHPAETRLRSVIDQLLFGDRPDPLDAATKVVGRMSDDPTTALQLIREHLALPHVALVRDGEVVAASGAEVPHTRRLPVATSDGHAVELVVGLRPGDLRLPDGDAHVLRLVAPLLVQILRAEQLAADVQASRSQAIAVIAEERRRLRRDLHDGLGPALTGIAFSIDAARNTLPGDPAGARGLLADVRQDTAEAIAQIRGLVYGMRPPALDELGLGPALRQQAAGLRRNDGELLPVGFRIDDDLPGLPAAVEVAAYRIVMEALTNVARHTCAAHATVRLAAPDGQGLEVEVCDDGAPRAAWTAGVGITSMHERAAEVGGSLTAGPTPTGGCVLARLPITGESGLAGPSSSP